MMDSVTAFHWTTVETQYTNTIDACVTVTGKTNARILSLLDQIMHRYGCRLIATHGFLFPPKDPLKSEETQQELLQDPKFIGAIRTLPWELFPSGSTSDVAPLGPKWKSMVTHRFHVVPWDNNSNNNNSQVASFYLAKMMKPWTVSKEQRATVLAEEGPQWVEYGVLPWEIHATGIA
jgi:hypothetical protein